jgi:hypothetical protein
MKDETMAQKTRILHRDLCETQSSGIRASAHVKVFLPKLFFPMVRNNWIDLRIWFQRKH